MQVITTIGFDIAKSVFQVHGVDADGQVVIHRQLKRRYVLALFQKLPPCLVGIEACASSHHWSRELKALGHTVRLMPPAYVKPYVKRQKNDAADAEAICEAVMRPTMRFVATKTAAFEFERARTTITGPCAIKDRFAIVDQLARRREGLARRTGVDVVLLVEREVVPTKGPTPPLRLVDNRDGGSNLLLVDEPIEVRCRAVGCIRSKPLG